eukprot:TRINITY_DN788_c0_g1_i1.p2 TRINITY_DN788_c0_g1~~TRINITY_DN788_c0_g1_i1.p2  ORF type:complete len:250 (+),score=75.11 TRINITY_DN788_c0_g1_i1:52-801(+)
MAKVAGSGDRLVVGYWRHRCLGNCIRYLLAHSGAAWEDKRYEVGNAPSFDKTCWFKEKPAFGPFSNLPYLIDGELKITQTSAILRHLGRRFGYEGEDPASRARTDQILGASQDFMDAFTGFTYSAWLTFEAARPGYLRDRVPAMLRKYEEALSEVGPWMAGEKLTYCDFFVYELLDEHRLFCGDGMLEEFPKVREYMARFEEGKIAEYRASPDFIRTPVHNRYSNFTVPPGEAAYAGTHPGEVRSVMHN